MGINAALIVQVDVTGSGIGQGGSPLVQTQSAVNANAPPPTSYLLGAGQNGFTFPTGFTLNSIILVPPTGSTNTKVLKETSGDVGFGSWTSQTVALPAASGGSIDIQSVGTETIFVVFA